MNNDNLERNIAYLNEILILIKRAHAEANKPHYQQYYQGFIDIDPKPIRKKMIELINEQIARKI